MQRHALSLSHLLHHLHWLQVPTGRGALALCCRHNMAPSRTSALDRPDRSDTTSTFWLSLTTDHATNATSQFTLLATVHSVWQPHGHQCHLIT